MSPLYCILVAALIFGVSYADTDTCQSTLERIKSAARVANTWRASCEDSKWRGAQCYNYWAQVDELMMLETNYQDCEEKRHKENRAYLLGSDTTQGVFTIDATSSRSAEDSVSDVTDSTIRAEENQNRNQVISQFDKVKSATVAQIATQARDGRSYIASESQTTQALELQQQTQLRASISAHTVQIQANVDNEEKATRDLVFSAHASLQSQVSAVAQTDGESSRSTTASEETQTRTLASSEHATTADLETTTNHSTTTTIKSEESANRVAYDAAYASVSSLVHDTSQGLRAKVTDTSNNDMEVTGDSAATTRSQIQSDDATTKAKAMQVGGELRSALSILQAASVLQMNQEKGLFSNMWATIFNITAHLDLQAPQTFWPLVFGGQTFQDTNFYQLPKSKGGNLEVIRQHAYETMTYNEGYYGASKVGSARYYWGKAEDYLAARNYRAAANSYRACYAVSVACY